MKKFIFLSLLIISIPIMNINFFYSYKQNKIVTGFITNKIEKENKKIRVLKKDNKIETMNLEDYLVGVVSSEVPVYFEDEALKAQAVAARTYALKQMQNNSNKEYDVTDDVSSQVYKNDDELKKEWGNNYDKYISKIKNAVDSTKGEYVSYNNDIIYAFFFSTSNGYTEDNVNVFGQDLPYLKSVNSSFDETETSSFLNTKTMSLNEFYNKIGIPYSDNLNIDNIIKSDSGRILSLSINSNKYTGRNLQSKLELRSNDFEIKKNNDKITITTKGYGHGVGMSQYGANALAKQNKTYQEILKYYYLGTNIQKL